MRILIKQRPVGEIMNVCFPWPLSSQLHVMLPVERAAGSGQRAAGSGQRLTAAVTRLVIFQAGSARCCWLDAAYLDNTPGYTDTAPHPATLTRWTYRAIYHVDDAQIGLWSTEVSVTVGG